LSHLFEFLCSFLGQQKSRPSQIDEVDQAGIISPDSTGFRGS
jgi:hypothetical protein